MITAALTFLGAFALHTAATLWLFIVIMKWKAAGLTKETAGPLQRAVFALGLFLDVTYNYAPWGGSLALLQFPRRGETMFTHHLQRIKRQSPLGYRYAVACVYCSILNFFDINHCREVK